MAADHDTSPSGVATRQCRLIALVVAFSIAGALLASAGAMAAHANVVWLCKPGKRPDPCTAGYSTTFVTRTLHPYRTTDPARHPPKIDCFYVYPTISTQPTTYSSRRIEPSELAVAHLQIARLSQECRVYAPMYRQITLVARLHGNQETPAELSKPLSDVRAAFDQYLTRDNDGRGFVLVGHSQGSRVLRLLIAQDVDPVPAVRDRMLSAILPGGNVLVKRGSDVDGDFRHVPACRTRTSLGCVIAYSTFDQTPPAASLFGRSANPRDEVLCVNPAALIGARTITPIFPTTGFGLGMLPSPIPTTVWTAEPNAYQAHCVTDAGARVLKLDPLAGAQTPVPAPTVDWGLHLLDLNIEQGDLVKLIGTETSAYERRTSR